MSKAEARERNRRLIKVKMDDVFSEPGAKWSIRLGLDVRMIEIAGSICDRIMCATGCYATTRELLERALDELETREESGYDTDHRTCRTSRGKER